MDMFSCGWLWIYAGALTVLAELVMPGFILCFFGLSAITVGVLRFLFGAAFDPTWQLAAFSVLSVVYLVFLRRLFKRSLMGDKAGDHDLQSEYIGRTGKVVEAIEPPRTGRIELGDAQWTAAADAPIAAGTGVKVISQNNLTMKVEAI